MDYYEIGQKIRRVRKAHGLSQEELAERVNISTTHMSHIETGNTKLSLPVLVDIAATLEVRTDDLLHEDSTVTISTAMDEIASVLSIRSSTVKSQLYRAREKLKVLLEGVEI